MRGPRPQPPLGGGPQAGKLPAGSEALQTLERWGAELLSDDKPTETPRPPISPYSTKLRHCRVERARSPGNKCPVPINSTRKAGAGEADRTKIIQRREDFVFTRTGETCK